MLLCDIWNDFVDFLVFPIDNAWLELSLLLMKVSSLVSRFYLYYNPAPFPLKKSINSIKSINGEFKLKNRIKMGSITLKGFSLLSFIGWVIKVKANGISLL